LSFILFISCLAETNRIPFGFAEGGSELVSGCNVEYGGGGGVSFNFFEVRVCNYSFYEFIVLYYLVG